MNARQKRYLELKEAGLCVSCGKVPATAGVYCPNCHAKYLLEATRKRLEKQNRAEYIASMADKKAREYTRKLEWSLDLERNCASAFTAAMKRQEFRRLKCRIVYRFYRLMFRLPVSSKDGVSIPVMPELCRRCDAPCEWKALMKEIEHD